MGGSKLFSLPLWKLDLYPLGILITIENLRRYSDLIYYIRRWDLLADLENWVKIGLNLNSFSCIKALQDSYSPSNQHNFWILLKLHDQIIHFHTTLPFCLLEKSHYSCFIHFSAVFIWHLEKLSISMIKLAPFKNNLLVLSLSYPNIHC